MSSLVTSVPALQWPLEAGPGWQAWVNAPTTTTSLPTTAVDKMVAVEQPPEPNHWVHTLGSVVPAKTLGVQGTAAGDTTPDSGMAAPAGAIPNRASTVLITEASIVTRSSRVIRIRSFEVRRGPHATDLLDRGRVTRAVGLPLLVIRLQHWTRFTTARSARNG